MKQVTPLCWHVIIVACTGTRVFPLLCWFDCLSLERGTRWTGKPHVDAIKDGAFIFENGSSMKFLNLRRVFVCNYPFKRLFIACVTNKVVIFDDGYALHYENSHAWSTIWYNNQATIQSTFWAWTLLSACTLPGWTAINRIGEILEDREEKLS